MNALLISESKSAGFIIRSLIGRGHQITLISKDRNLCQCLSDTFEIQSVFGDAEQVSVLEQADIINRDLVVAMHENDAENLVACELAKSAFRVKMTIASVNNPANIPFFLQSGIDRCISEADFLNELISKENIGNSISQYLPHADREIVVKEVVLDAKSSAVNKKLWEIPLPPQSLIGCILRNGKAIVPQGNTECKEKDRVILVASVDALEETLSILAGV